ncbi:MAG: glycosyltransferase family 4 protein [Silvanigrellales bacterium]|nr:glycosyltransferase family 4 protein [Silvanigrellales bacterium]
MEAVRYTTSSLPGTLPGRRRVVIDARVVTENHGHGIARYTEEYLRQLASLPCTDLEFVVLTNRESPLCRQAWPPHIRLVLMRSGWLAFWGQAELGFVLWRLNSHMFHSPSFIVPFLSRTPLITTIHDLNHVVLAENYSIFHRLYYNVFLAHKVRLARCVVTVSHFSKSEIVNFFGIPPSLVKVVYNGISDVFFRSPRSSTSAEAAVIREKFELPDDYILSVGNRKPHKNMCRLVEAWCGLPHAPPLVLLTEFDPAVSQIAARYGRKHELYFLRFVTNSELPFIYSLARAFVYPSLYEGFGLPPLEAAACGVPVVVSNRSSLPEVLAGSAIFVNPEDVLDIRRGIEEALSRSSEVLAVVERGRAKASEYSWSRMAEETISVYRHILA